MRNDAVDRLKKENEELTLTLQTDQYKSIRTLEVIIQYKNK
jgi:hypothetical protein